MKTYLYALILIMVLGGFYKSSSAQNIISYSCDAAGNRSYRTLKITKTAEIEPASNDTTQVKNKNKADKNKYSDKLGNVSFTLYPNPTKNSIEIEAENLVEDINCEIQVYNSKGTLLKKQAWVPNNNKVDLSTYAQGVYFVKFIAGTDITQWKVIKE